MPWPPSLGFLGPGSSQSQTWRRCLLNAAGGRECEPRERCPQEDTVLMGPFLAAAVSG